MDVRLTFSPQKIGQNLRLIKNNIALVQRPIDNITLFENRVTIKWLNPMCTHNLYK